MVGIGFFAPLPLAIMIPFMAAQSAVMGEAFGKHYQYGKRKISSMTNEEFNKLDGGDIFGSIVTDYKKIIPQVAQAMTASKEFQDRIISELIAIVPRIPGAIQEGLFGQQQEEPGAGALGNIPLTAGSNLVSGGAFIALQKILRDQQLSQIQINKANNDFFREWQKALAKTPEEFGVETGTIKGFKGPPFKLPTGSGFKSAFQKAQEIARNQSGTKPHPKFKAPASQVKIMKSLRAQLKATQTQLTSPQYAGFKFQKLRQQFASNAAAIKNKMFKLNNKYRF